MFLHHAFAYPLALVLLALLPVLGLLALWARRRRRQALACLGSTTALEGLLGRRWKNGLVRGLCLTCGLACLGAGTAGPQWGRDWSQSAAPGRDLVVVLDCSRSMFAEAPSRLERARAGLLDLCGEVEKRGGHRLALVVFAGRAKRSCPLTLDYDHFRETVSSLDLTANDPDLEPRLGMASGTRIGQGLAEALAAHDPRFRGARDILLLSDGDDPARDGEWRPAADDAARQGIPVHVVGIGDPDRAHPIPLAAAPDGWLHYEGREVLTRLQEAPLREIAQRTHGLYEPAGTRTLPLGALYLNVIAGQPVREESDDALPVYRSRYRWLLLPAFALLALSMAIPDQVRRARSAPDFSPPPPSLPETATP
jgi:Ca-activated chloride channel family protein